MGLDGMSVGSLVLILVIVMVLFGTKRIKNIGADLGSALRGFKKGVREANDSKEEITNILKTESDKPETATDERS